MSDSEIKVAFNPSGQRGTFPRGTILLDAAKSLGVDIDSVCGGEVSAASARSNAWKEHFLSIK